MYSTTADLARYVAALIWSEICGWYSPAPGPVTNLSLRVLFGAGAEVVVQGGHLMLKPLTPIPAMRRDFRPYPDDPDDLWVFRIYFPEFGMNLRVVFDSRPQDGTAMRLLMDVMSFEDGLTSATHDLG